MFLWKRWCCPGVTQAACNQPNHLAGEIWICRGAQAVAKNYLALNGAGTGLQPGPLVDLQELDPHA